MRHTLSSKRTVVVATCVAVHAAAWVVVAVGYPSSVWSLLMLAFWAPLAVLAGVGVVALAQRATRTRRATAGR